MGAVDKLGNVEDYSAKGDKLEVVAPGELIKTTGFLDSYEVTSGTSLASPQVAAVASLIYEKDLDVSADFVRGLIDESANLYGDETSYGNGLVDAEYALEHYDEYKKAYEKYEENKKTDKDFEEPELEENEKEITTFDDTGCVEGSWTGDDHEKVVSSVSKSLYVFRRAVRFPDKIWSDEDKDTSKDFRFYGWIANPWWHGSYKTNYIMTTIYAMRMGNAIKQYGKEGQIFAFYSDDIVESAENMQKDVKEMDKINMWKKELDNINSIYGLKNKDSIVDNTQFRREFLWGIALHNITDVYAHSTRYTSNGKNEDILHPQADQTNYVSQRYTDASDVARKVILCFENGNTITANDLLPNSAPTEYKIYNLSGMIARQFGAEAAKNVSSYSYNKLTK